MKAFLIVFITLFSIPGFGADQEAFLEIDLPKAQFLVRPPIPADQALMQSLPPREQELFLQTREQFLNQTARALTAVRWAFGIGVLVRDRLQYSREKKELENMLLLSEQWTPSLRDDLLRSITENQSLVIEKKSLKDKTLASIQSLLEQIDKQLWQQAPIVANSNEFGIMAALGVELEAGRGQKGYGGLTDLGISLGYNRDSQALAIQVFHDLESYKSTQMPAVFIGGLVSKVGIYIANQDAQIESAGSSFYPPMAPGFSSTTDRSFVAGFSSGLTWPPSPLGDMLTYTNHLHQTILFRLTLSKLTPGFVRLQSGAFIKIWSFAKQSVQSLTRSLQKKSVPLLCEQSLL